MCFDASGSNDRVFKLSNSAGRKRGGDEEWARAAIAERRGRVARRLRRYLPRVRCTSTPLRLPARIVESCVFLKKI